MSMRVKILAAAACVAMIGCDVIITGSSGGGDSDDGISGDTVLTGKIEASATAKIKARSAELAANQGYMVVAQNTETGDLYRQTTDASGEFELPIADADAGDAFIVTILGQDGRAVGPVIYSQVDDGGVTGLTIDGEVSLGTLNLPDDPEKTPLGPGDQADLTSLLDADVVARLDANGVPVGLASHGKGDAARGEADSDADADADHDGLIDMLDADDDGDGIVDDFDDGGVTGGGSPDVLVNFFMNLKIAAEQAQTYYSGTDAQISTALGTDTIITFEVMTQSGATRSITAANVLETPGPTYLPAAEKQSDGAGGLTYTTWADSDYAFDAASDRFQAFVRPNDEMDAGDTFTVEISYDDGTTEQTSRMINYVFKNIPKLLQYGSSGSLSSFDVADATVNGTPDKAVPFDGAKDLVLVFSPPPDETGALLTDCDYTFQIFYHAASDSAQLNSRMDKSATWTTAPTGFEAERTTFPVSNSDLTLSASNTYTVTLPKEIFPDTVETDSGTTTVGYYKIDITAEAPTGNAAIMLAFKKQ